MQNHPCHVGYIAINTQSYPMKLCMFIIVCRAILKTGYAHDVLFECPVGVLSVGKILYLNQVMFASQRTIIHRLNPAGGRPGEVDASRDLVSS